MKQAFPGLVGAEGLIDPCFPLVPPTITTNYTSQNEAVGDRLFSRLHQKVKNDGQCVSFSSRFLNFAGYLTLAFLLTYPCVSGYFPTIQLGKLCTLRYAVGNVFLDQGAGPGMQKISMAQTC